MTDPLPLKGSMEFAYGTARELAPGVSRLVANNPSPFTFKGTNTYLIGTDELALIDPGPDDPAHCQAIMDAADGRPITHILISHTHLDHTAGLAPLLDVLRPLYGTKTCGYGRTDRNPGARDIKLSGKAFIDVDFKPDIIMADGDKIEGKDWTLSALFTPGHAPDHLCFALEGTGIVFTGDHVMSWNTSVVAPPEGNMADYMASLERLLRRDDHILMLPGHGGQMDRPRRMVRAYMVHRQMREKAILSAIRNGTNSIEQIVKLIYKGLDEKLITAASLSVQAHVEHLISLGFVTCDGDVSFGAALAAV